MISALPLPEIDDPGEAAFMTGIFSLLDTFAPPAAGGGTDCRTACP